MLPIGKGKFPTMRGQSDDEDYKQLRREDKKRLVQGGGIQGWASFEHVGGSKGDPQAKGSGPLRGGPLVVPTFQESPEEWLLEAI